jgi:hypothetical protein
MPDDTAATRDELDRTIEALTRTELLKVKHFAACRVQGLGRASCGRTWEDLLSEAMLSTLEGAANNGNGRRWNKDVDFVTHLSGAVRSISSHWKRDFSEDEAHLESEIMAQSDEDVWISPIDNARSGDPSQERGVAAREEWGLIETLCRDDPAAEQVLEGWLRGMTASEIMQNSLTRWQYRQAAMRIRLCLCERDGTRGSKRLRGGGRRDGWEK